MIIGITGKSGVGKTTYANQLADKNGYYVIHIDEISHQIMKKQFIKDELINMFGNEILYSNGLIKRKYLGDLVFSNRHLYKDVSDLIWAAMKIEINKILKEHENVILDWILLPHSHYWDMCDEKILLIADETKRKYMVLERDNISEEYLEKRDNAGIDYSSIEFDKVIKNTYKGEI